MKAFKVAPYDQHLMFNGVPLLDGLATLGHLGIIPGSTLLLKVCIVTSLVDSRPPGHHPRLDPPAQGMYSDVTGRLSATWASSPALHSCSRYV